MTSLAPDGPTGQASPLQRLATFLEDMNVWTVRDGRNADVAATLRSEQMRLIGRRMVISATSQSAAAAVLVVMLWRDSSSMLLLTWLSCLCAIALLNLYRWNRLRKLTAGSGSGDPLGDSAIRHYLYLGLLWGAIVLATVDSDAGLAEASTILIVSGLCASAASSLFSLPQAAFAFVLAAMFPTCIALLNVGSVEGYALAGLTLLFVASLCYSICLGYGGVLSIVRSELEQEKLTTALRSAQALMEETFRETEEDLATAREMQMRILPAPKYIKRLREKLGICVEAYFEPSAQLGGDYWYIFPQNEAVARFAISDFAGHGVQAALNTFSLAALLSRLGSREPSPSAALMRLNSELCPLLQTGQYATVLLGEIDLEQNVMRYAGSGGPSPLIYDSRSGEIATGNPRGLPVGISRMASYENREMPFQDGDLLILHSDALTECEGRDGKMIGDGWLRETICRHMRGQGAAGIVDAIMAEFRRMVPDRPSDDVTLMAVWSDQELRTEKSQSPLQADLMHRIDRAPQPAQL